MSKSSKRHQMRLARRAKCKAHLSSYLVDHPGTVSPDLAARFLMFGRKPECLDKFMAQEKHSASFMQIPEHIKKQARGYFNAIQAVRARKAKVANFLAEKKRQRQSRKIHRRGYA